MVHTGNRIEHTFDRSLEGHHDRDRAPIHPTRQPPKPEASHPNKPRFPRPEWPQPLINPRTASRQGRMPGPNRCLRRGDHRCGCPCRQQVGLFPLRRSAGRTSRRPGWPDRAFRKAIRCALAARARRWGRERVPSRRMPPHRKPKTGRPRPPWPGIGWRAGHRVPN